MPRSRMARSCHVCASFLGLGLGLCLGLGAALSAQGKPAGSPPDSSSARTKTVFVTAIGESGAPVLDLAADDLTLKEDGKTRDIVKVEVANVPMQVMILVDDSGSGIFRSGVAQFVQQLQGRAEIAISSVVGQTQKLVDYTTNMDALQTAIGSLAVRPGTPDGGQLLEGIYQASKDQEKREALRPVIVALTVGGEEHSTLPAHYVLDQLAKTGSRLYVISVAASTIRPRVPVGKPSALLEENLNLGEVLGQGPKQTGGQRVEIVATPGILLGLQNIANELKNQYAVAYSRQTGNKSMQRLNISINRRGVTLRAPSRVPGS